MGIVGIIGIWPPPLPGIIIGAPAKVYKAPSEARTSSEPTLQSFTHHSHPKRQDKYGVLATLTGPSNGSFERPASALSPWVPHLCLRSDSLFVGCGQGSNDE